MFPLSAAIQQELISLDGVSKVKGERFYRIYAEGDRPDYVYLLDSGLVKASVTGRDDKEIVLSIVSPGHLFGLHGVLLERARSSHAVVLADAVFHEIPQRSFLQYCEQRPEVWRYLAQVLARRQGELHRKIQLLVLHDVEYRLLTSLLELAELCGPEEPNGSVYSIPLSQEDLADIIGATRETTSNKLNVLARRKLLVLGRRRVVISSLDALRAALTGQSKTATVS